MFRGYRILVLQTSAICQYLVLAIAVVFVSFESVVFFAPVVFASSVVAFPVTTNNLTRVNRFDVIQIRNNHEFLLGIN